MDLQPLLLQFTVCIAVLARVGPGYNCKQHLTRGPGGNVVWLLMAA